MPIKLPNLDDRTFADLVAEAHTLIPVHAPEWTNHNESDPGITLVELFAYLTEMQIYRLNRVTDANVCAFLKLIDGIERIPSTRNRGMVCRVEGNKNALSKEVGDVVSKLRSQSSALTCEEFERLAGGADLQLKIKEFALRDEVRAVVLNLREQDRAVTCEDFERLALVADQRVSRAFCVSRRDLDSSSPYAIANAQMSVVILPTDGARALFFDKVFWFDGKDFSDVTSASAGRGATIPLMPPTAPAEVRLFLGSSTIFESISFALSETGAGYTLAFEYFNGKDWAKLTTDKHDLVDNTSNWSASGLVTFTPPTDWQQGNVNNTNAYWLRISTSAAPTKRAVANRISRDLIERVSQYLEPRRLLTTRVHVVGPRFVTIGVHVNLGLKVDAVAETVTQKVVDRLNQFLNPQAWPFGRNVYVSEIYRLLDRIPGVDFITKVGGTEIVTAHSVTKVDGTEIVETKDVRDKRRILQGTELVAIRLNPDELVNFSLENSDIVPVPPTAKKLET